MPADMELENKTFPNGRHRNKTYFWVFENDKDFCRMVINGEKNRFIPEDFSDFLYTKIEHFSPPLSVYNGRAFIRAFDEDLRRQFRSVVGELDIKKHYIHSPCNTTPNGFLGVLYRFFVQKHVANLTNTDGYRRYLQKYAGIFPFPVLDLVGEREIDIFNVIEDELELLDEMQAFLDEHFDDVEIRSVSRKLFDNILNCKQKNVSEQTILSAVKDLDVKGLSANEGVDKNVSCVGTENCEYLKNYPRLNDAGVLRYQMIYNMILEVTKLYEKPCNVSAFKYETNYLLKLPEINFYELYSLLNVDFLKSDPEEYVYRFKKYLFFFINALNNQPNPVFFIDDGLFEGLLHYSIFRKSRNDVEMLKFELTMLTLVYRRKQSFDANLGTFCLENCNLRDVKNYLNNFPDISNALAKHEMSTELMHSTALVATERAAMNVYFKNYSPRYTKPINEFYELIIYGALSPSNIQHLVVYNAFSGEEKRISMPSNKSDVIEFIRKYNKYDFTRTAPPEQLLTRGLQLYYEGDVSKWDSRQYFRY